MKENPILTKSFSFAEKILDAYFFLRDKGHYKLADQLVGAGTSIGANVEEAQAAHSKTDFIAKLTIANKEARECHYWLRLLDRDRLLASFPETAWLKSQIVEIINLLNAIIIKTRSNLRRVVKRKVE